MRLRCMPKAPYGDKVLEFDSEREELVLSSGESTIIRTLSWDLVLRWFETPSSGAPVLDGRTYPRTALAIPVRYRTESQPACQAMSADISGGGLFIESIRPLHDRTRLELEFALPTQPGLLITAQATVAWTRPQSAKHLLAPGMGLAFTSIDPEAQARIVAFLATLARLRR